MAYVGLVPSEHSSGDSQRRGRITMAVVPGCLDQHVAVKLLQGGLDPQSQAVERLRDEARLLVSLRHPVVLAAHDLVELGGQVALVTEFIEGQDLSACIDPSAPGRKGAAEGGL